MKLILILLTFMTFNVNAQTDGIHFKLPTEPIYDNSKINSYYIPLSNVKEVFKMSDGIFIHLDNGTLINLGNNVTFFKSKDDNTNIYTNMNIYDIRTLESLSHEKNQFEIYQFYDIIKGDYDTYFTIKTSTY